MRHWSLKIATIIFIFIMVGCSQPTGGLLQANNVTPLNTTLSQQSPSSVPNIPPAPFAAADPDCGPDISVTAAADARLVRAMIARHPLQVDTTVPDLTGSYTYVNERKTPDYAGSGVVEGGIQVKKSCLLPGVYEMAESSTISFFVIGKNHKIVSLWTALGLQNGNTDKDILQFADGKPVISEDTFLPDQPNRYFWLGSFTALSGPNYAAHIAASLKALRPFAKTDAD